MSEIPNLSDQCKIITPSSPDYNEAIARNTLTAVVPAKYVVYPNTPSDVSALLEFARTQKPPLPIAVKGGGINSVPASSSDGITIDLSQMKYVKLAEDKQSVTVGGGANWGDVYSALEEHDLIVVGANAWAVGVGGFILGGGHSNLSGQHGFGSDNLLEATVVLADGRIVKCDADHEPDLFWAIRGAGNQFGVVTELVLKTHPAHGPALVGVLVYAPNQLEELLNVLEKRSQSPKQTFIVTFARSPPEYHPSLLLLPYVEGTPAEIETVLAPFRTEVTPLFEQTGLAPTYNAVSHGADSILSQFPPRRITGGALFSAIWNDLLKSIYDEWLTFTGDNESKSTIIMWEFFPSGKYTEIPVRDTAYAARKRQNYFLVHGLHTSQDKDTPTREWITRLMLKVNDTNLAREGFRFPTPVNMGLGTESPEEIYGENLQRLRELKTKYDPNQVFNKKYWTIPPLTPE
ncbi:hypothetical protein Clacol_010126 [Clathrus columnatus]|uniref:FAD-binding PCMH-type domain-containing protein n=1 Tax=Clathrus columnatus TaxID=1419009 RepID=A0AAV5AS61_9AGAM|nr:hypothetical protein Clacol_010126 [Clathrus columnatus]